MREGGLTVSAVSKSFPSRTPGEPDLRVLVDISFGLAPGEIVGVVGPSGCGKTTLLRIIAGLEAADAGTCILDGSPITRPRSDIAIVFQLFNLFPWRTVRENAEFGLQMLGLPKTQRRDRARRLLTTVGLAKFEEYYPYQLSGGMQQRVGLARALAIDPALLLMDEPFGALDYQTADRLRDEVLKLQAQTRKMILMITHNIDEALYMCDRVVVLSAQPGRVVKAIAPRFPTPRWEHDVQALPEFAVLRSEVKQIVMGG